MSLSAVLEMYAMRLRNRRGNRGVFRFVTDDTMASFRRIQYHSTRGKSRATYVTEGGPVAKSGPSRGWHADETLHDTGNRAAIEFVAQDNLENDLFARADLRAAAATFSAHTCQCD